MSRSSEQPSTGDASSAATLSCRDESRQGTSTPSSPESAAEATAREPEAAADKAAVAEYRVIVAAAHEAPELTFLEQAAALRQMADKLEETAVFVEKSRGASWEEIGGTIGVAKGTAYERYSKRFRTWAERRQPHQGDAFTDAYTSLDAQWGQVAKLVARRQLQTDLRTFAGSLEPEPHRGGAETPQDGRSAEVLSPTAVPDPNNDSADRASEGTAEDPLEQAPGATHAGIAARVTAGHDEELPEAASELREFLLRLCLQPEFQPAVLSVLSSGRYSIWDAWTGSIARHQSSFALTRAERNALVHGSSTGTEGSPASAARMDELERRQSRLEAELAELRQPKHHL